MHSDEASALGCRQAVENLRERQSCEAQCRVQLGELEGQVHRLLGTLEGSELSALTLQIGHLSHPIMRQGVRAARCPVDPATHIRAIVSGDVAGTETRHRTLPIRVTLPEEKAMQRLNVISVAALGVMGLTAQVGAAHDPKLSHRPQEEAIAAAPVPYREELVTFANPEAADVRLAGTLTLPPQGAQRFPGILLIAGSGRNARNEEFGGHHEPFLVLADTLTRQGCAVLRYDKRGIGQSTGDYPAATTPDFASDAAAAVAYLRSRPDVDGARVGLVGHSEGANIAAMLAGQDPGVAFIVMLAPAALPGGVLVAEQNRRMAMADGETREAAAQTYRLERRLYAAIVASTDPQEAQARVRAILRSAEPTPSPAEARQAIHFTELPYMRFILAYDPRPALAAVRVPALALYGSKDLISPSDLNLPALRKALARDRDARIVEIPGLNHFFQHAHSGSRQEFATIDETLAPELLTLTSGWIAQHTH